MNDHEQLSDSSNPINATPAARTPEVPLEAPPGPTMKWDEPYGQLSDSSKRSEIAKNGSSEMPIWKEVLLWIAILPGAIFGALIALWFARLWFWFYSNADGRNTWGFYIFRQIVSDAVCGSAFVHCAYFIAPRHQIRVAITFAAILLLSSTFTFVTAFSGENWMWVIGCIATDVGAIAGVVVLAAKSDDSV